MTLAAYRFEARKECPFRYDAYGFHCLIKERIAEGTETPICGFVGFHNDKSIPSDCPLKDGAITIGLMERRYEDDKQLVKKVFNMLEAYVDMKHEAKEKGTP